MSKMYFTKKCLVAGTSSEPQLSHMKMTYNKITTVQNLTNNGNDKAYFQ